MHDCATATSAGLTTFVFVFELTAASHHWVGVQRDVEDVQRHTFLLICYRYSSVFCISLKQQGALPERHHLSVLRQCARDRLIANTPSLPLWDAFHIFVLGARDWLFLQARAMRKSSKCERQSPAGGPQFELQWFHCANRWLHKEEVHVCTVTLHLHLTLNDFALCCCNPAGTWRIPHSRNLQKLSLSGELDTLQQLFPPASKIKALSSFDNADTVAQLPSVSSGQEDVLGWICVMIRRLSQLSPVTSFKLFHKSLFILNSSS